MINDALASAELGASLTSRLMVLAGRGNLIPVESDLRKLCSDTLVLLKRTLGERYQIKTDYAADLDIVLIDPVQLQSALMNLALNARDAMGEGGELLVSINNVTIDDSYLVQETNIEFGNYVRLSVSDKGPGMTPKAQRRAFDPFFTPKSESAQTVRRTDQGPWICHTGGRKWSSGLKEGAAVDLVFSDLVMPGELNGFELAAKIAAEFTTLKVLLASGSASDVVSGTLAHGNSHDILHKPYRQSDHASRLQALLKGVSDS